MPRQATTNRQALPATQNLVRYSEDLTNAAWSKLAGITVSISTEAGTPALFPSSQVSKVVYDGTGALGGGRFFQSIQNPTASGIPNYIGFWARTLSGTVGLQIGNNIGGANTAFTVTSSWQFFTFSRPTTSSGLLTLSIFGDAGSNAAATFYMTNFQSVFANWLPPYVTTTASAFSSSVNPRNQTSNRASIPQTQNLALRSEEIDNASWTKIRLTISANVIAAPAALGGGLTADGLIADGSANNHPALQLSTQIPQLATNAGDIFCVSVYAKRGNKDHIFLFMSGASTGRYFNINTGVVGTTVGTLITSGIRDEGNGWYRCFIVGRTINAGSTGVYPVESDGSLVFTGDGATINTYVSGFQFVEANWLPPYIQTTSSQVNASPGIRNLVANT